MVKISLELEDVDVFFIMYVLRRCVELGDDFDRIESCVRLHNLLSEELVKIQPLHCEENHLNQ